jgi:hypothetical protein
MNTSSILLCILLATSCLSAQVSSTEGAVRGDSGAMTIDSRAIRKVRRRIIPFIFLLYLVSYLDRSNIAFAALNMNKELAITSQQFGLAKPCPAAASATGDDGARSRPA